MEELKYELKEKIIDALRQADEAERWRQLSLAN